MAVSEEFSGDEEIIELVSSYRSLQAEFQTIYGMVEERRQISPVSKNNLKIINRTFFNLKIIY